jgi:hypothetical protein
MRRFHPLLALGLSIGLALGATACGGDDSSSSAATTSAAAGSSGSTATTATSASAGNGSTTSIDLGSGGGAFCEKTRNQMKELLNGGLDQFTSLLPALADPSKADSARSQLKDLFTDLRSKNQALVDGAPSEIRDDLKTLSGASDAVYDALEKAGYDFTKIDASTLTQATDNAKMTAASERVNAYFKDKCGIDLNAAG